MRPLPASLRRQRALAAVLLTAGAAVAATAVLIGTDALSDDTRTRAAAPGRGTASPSAALPTGGASAPAPSGPASPTATRSPSPDATAPEATVLPYRTPAPRPPAPTRASGSVSDSPATHGPSAPPTGPLVLREGAAARKCGSCRGGCGNWRCIPARTTAATTRTYGMPCRATSGPTGWRAIRTASTAR